MLSKLNSALDELALLTEREERFEYLIDLGERFKEVAPEIAQKPYPEGNRVPGCESDVFLFPRDNEDNTLTFHFAVENPQGVSAKALATILTENLSGVALEEVATVPDDIVFKIFGKELSMGKGLGLKGMVQMVRESALLRL